MRKLLGGFLIVSALACLCVRADIITLTDGRTVEGDIVSETPTEIVVQLKIGKTTIKREEIQTIEKRKSIGAVYRDKIDELDKSKDRENKDAWLNLAEEAKRKGARDEAPNAYNHVIAIDPDDAIARNALGFVKRNGNWVLRSDAKNMPDADAGGNAPASASVPGGSDKADEPAMSAEVQGWVERAEREADAGNLDQSFKYYRKAIQANGTVTLRKRFAAFYFGCGEKIREGNQTEFSALTKALEQARDGAYDDTKSMVNGKLKKFNPNNKAFIAAEAAYQECLKKYSVCYPFYERAEENYAVLLNLAPGHKDFDSAAHQILCLTIRNDEVHTQTRVKQLLIAFVKDYNPGNSGDQTLYDRCKAEFDKRDK